MPVASSVQQIGPGIWADVRPTFGAAPGTYTVELLVAGGELSPRNLPCILAVQLDVHRQSQSDTSADSPSASETLQVQTSFSHLLEPWSRRPGRGPLGSWSSVPTNSFRFAIALEGVDQDSQLAVTYHCFDSRQQFLFKASGTWPLEGDIYPRVESGRFTAFCSSASLATSAPRVCAALERSLMDAARKLELIPPDSVSVHLCDRPELMWDIEPSIPMGIGHGFARYDSELCLLMDDTGDLEVMLSPHELVHLLLYKPGGVGTFMAEAIAELASEDFRRSAGWLDCHTRAGMILPWIRHVDDITHLLAADTADPLTYVVAPSLLAFALQLGGHRLCDAVPLVDSPAGDALFYLADVTVESVIAHWRRWLEINHTADPAFGELFQQLNSAWYHVPTEVDRQGLMLAKRLDMQIRNRLNKGRLDEARCLLERWPFW